MTREELFERATDPLQYDASELEWEREGAPDAPTTAFFVHYLRPEVERFAWRSAVDVGCGSGRLAPLLRERAGARVVGLEPSAQNAAAARRAFPGLEVIETPLQEATLPADFDLALAVMSFEHQPDLDRAFRAVLRLLRPGGRFLLVAGDLEFHLAARFGLGLETHVLPDGAWVVATRYPFGTIHDVIRPAAHYMRAGEAAGFSHARQVAMVPTPELLAVDREWREWEGRPVGHLFVLTLLSP